MFIIKIVRQINYFRWLKCDKTQRPNTNFKKCYEIFNYHKLLPLMRLKSQLIHLTQNIESWILTIKKCFNFDITIKKQLKS